MSNPTFGYLASLVPALKTREVLHTAPAGKVVEGKIVVTHRDPYPVRIRIGVSAGGVAQFNSENYILYDYLIGEGSSYESDNIYYGNDQSLVVWSDSPNTNFVIHGQIQDDPTDTGFVAAAKLDPRKNTTLYTVPNGEEALISIFVSNQGPTNGRFRLAISDEGAGSAITTDQYIEYNTDIVPRTSYQRTELKVRGNQSVVAWADNPDLAFSVYAKFNYSVISTDFTVGGDLSVGGDSSLLGNASVGGALSVTGTSTFFDNTTLGSSQTPATLTTYGSITGRNSSGVSTIVLQPSLGNITNTGSLITNQIITSGDLVVGSNKFVANSTTGNVTVAGSLDLQGGFGSNLNLLNNKVTNLADPTAATDAANRKYVDSKVVAFSIALG